MKFSHSGFQIIFCVNDVVNTITSTCPVHNDHYIDHWWIFSQLPFTMVTALEKLKSESLVPCYDNLEDILKARSTDKRIVVTMLNYAYVKLVFHWIFSFTFWTKTQPMFFKNLVLDICVTFPIQHISKMFLLYRILQLNYSVLMSEIDVVWIDDTRSRLIELSKDFDTISQGLFYADADNRRNIGFFLSSSTTDRSGSDERRDDKSQ